jgi:2'-5' RNA ligase
MAGFASDTFVTADLPPQVVSHVRAIRRQYGSARQFLPVEITIAGSSGVGVFDPGQDAAAALETLRTIAAATAPFPLELTGVARFPNSDVFYYAIRDVAPLEGLHTQIVRSGLAFKPSPFPFSPHLTIDTFEGASAGLERELLSLPVPEGRHMVETLSVYGLNGWDCRLVQRFALGPTRP